MIVNDIRPIMKAAQPSVTDTWDNLYQFFLNRVRDNLHVCLCFRSVWPAPHVLLLAPHKTCLPSFARWQLLQPSPRTMLPCARRSPDPACSS